jgi:hypothetical protein
MKTKISLLIACVIFAQATMAQINFGIKAGTNISKIEGKAFKDEFKYGYLAGAFAEIGFGKKLSIQPEVLFSQHQTRVDTAFSNIYENALDLNNYKDVKLNYLSIPIVLNYKLANILSLQLGPQFGILMNQDKTLLENGKEAFSKGDFSVLGGAQVNLKSLRFTGRYVIGLTDIKDVENINNKETWNNEGFQLSIGYVF